MGLSWGKSNGELYKVENEETLRRDSTNSAILETDMNSLELYRRRREIAKQKDKEIQEMREEIANLKDLVQQLINKEG
jgi:fumarate hydratase class II